MLSSVPPPTCQVVKAAPRTGTAGLNIFIKLDNLPGYTAWMLKNSDTGEELHVSDFGSLYGSTTVERTFDNLVAGKYEFVIASASGKGICCRHGFGRVEIRNDNDEVIWKNSGLFGKLKKVHLEIDENGSLLSLAQAGDGGGFWDLMIFEVSSWSTWFGNLFG